jgi:hypothetical protein
MALRCPYHAVPEFEAENCIDLIGVDWRRGGDAVASEGGRRWGKWTRGGYAGTGAHPRSMQGMACSTPASLSDADGFLYVFDVSRGKRKSGGPVLP